jgi:hypothetical protein
MTAYNSGIPNSKLSAITVPKYSARSVAVAAASAANQYGIIKIFLFNFSLFISGSYLPVAIPILPDKY